MCLTIANLPSTRYYNGWRYGCNDPQNKRPRAWWAERQGERLVAESEAGIKGAIDKEVSKLDQLTGAWA